MLINMKFSIKKIIDLLISLFFKAAIFLVPLYFGAFLKLNNAFELSKFIVFKILVLALLFLFCLDLLFFRKDIKKNINRYKKTVYFTVFFLLFLILSTIISIDSGISLRGIYDRQQGLELYIYLSLFFLLLLFNIKTKREIRSLCLYLSLSAFLVSIYAILQALGIDFFNWSESTKIRTTSTLGQPNYLASFLLFSLPLTAYLFFSSKLKFKKIFFWFLFLTQFIAFITTYSISSFLSLAGALFLTLALFLILNYKTIRRKLSKKIIINLALSILILLAGFGVLAKTQLINEDRIIGRLYNAVDFSAGSAGNRATLWKASIDIIKQRPFLGYGLESQKELFTKYYDFDWGVWNFINVRPNRAHNIILDTLITQGIIGLLVYLIILAFLLRIILINIKEHNNTLIYYCLFFIVASYGLFLQFNFHHITTLVLLTLTMAFIVILNKKTDIEMEVKKKKANSKIFYLKIIILLIISAGIAYQVYREVNKYKADYFFREIQIAYLGNQFFAANDMYGEIVKTHKNYSYYDQKYAQILADWIYKFHYLSFYDMGADILEEILPKITSQNFSDLQTRAKIYTGLGKRDEKYFALAQAEYEKLINYNPDFPATYRDYGLLYIRKGEAEKAEEKFKTAIAKMPDVNDKRLDNLHRERLLRELLLIKSELKNAYSTTSYHKTVEYEDEIKILEEKLSKIK